MKKFLALFLVVAMLFAFAACGTPIEEEVVEETTETEEEDATETVSDGFKEYTIDEDGNKVNEAGLVVVENEAGRNPRGRDQIAGTLELVEIDVDTAILNDKASMEYKESDGTWFKDIDASIPVFTYGLTGTVTEVDGSYGGVIMWSDVTTDGYNLYLAELKEAGFKRFYEIDMKAIGYTGSYCNEDGSVTFDVYFQSGSKFLRVTAESAYVDELGASEESAEG